MFEKIKYLIDISIIGFWYSFYTNYMKIKFSSTFSTRVFNRPIEYLNDPSNVKCDYIIDGYPVWVEPIECSEYLKLGNIFPNISNVGLISPICSELFDQDRKKMFGYIVLIPFEYLDDMKLYEFVLGHEIGHISHKHLSSNLNGKLVNDVEKEIDADKYSLTRHPDKYLTVDNCVSGLNKIFEISIKTTIENISYLKKKYENKIDEVISRFKKYNKSYKKRLEAISKLV